MLKSAFYKILQIIFVVYLIFNSGCINKKMRSTIDCDNFLHLIDKVQINESLSNLKTVIIDQIPADTIKSAKENLISFSDIRSFPGLETSKLSRIEVLNIYIDYGLLNKFTLVFMRHNAGTILGSIKQMEVIDKPKKNYCYYIYFENLASKFGEGEFDIYGFHNDRLVLKNSFTLRIDSLSGHRLIDF